MAADGSVEIMSAPNEEKDTAVVCLPLPTPALIYPRPSSRSSKREPRLLTRLNVSQSHSPSTEQLSEALASTNTASATAPDADAAPAEAADDGLDLGLMKKKKKKAKKEVEGEGAGDDAADDDGGLGTPIPQVDNAPHATQSLTCV